jgi:hypothetical protein
MAGNWESQEPRNGAKVERFLTAVLRRAAYNVVESSAEYRVSISRPSAWISAWRHTSSSVRL